MTTPAPHGFSDYGRLAAQADSVIINETGLTITSAHAYPNTFVGDKRSIMVWANATVGGIVVVMQFWGDAAKTIFLDSYLIEVAGGAKAIQPVRVMGPYVQVTVNLEGLATATYSLQLWSNPDYGTFDGRGSSDGSIAVTGSAIGGSTTKIDKSFVVLAGPAVWTGNVSTGNFTCYLEVTDATGVITIIDQMNNASPTFDSRTVYLPPSPVQIRTDNQAAGAGNYWIYLTRFHP
jgi:hypothetical protein